ncbi:rhodanese-like domain-containing protein [Candidatus Cyanaurora vandensis]|uniref:rhodanese-like domain-containing protein n=1 Tax=Candidatus Cyanaurora vandensis TaxID=2714958 RepID=UPI0025799682|nr:rhodanese-like domain-containing protein [Candidatus Cyanaurora vandensis]
MSVGVVTVQELAARLGQLDAVQLVDVREPEELALAALPGFRRFSLSEYGTWGPQITELLDPDCETLVLCHHGVRSAQMCGFLVSQGFTQVKNIWGGIAAYSDLDPTVPHY